MRQLCQRVSHKGVLSFPRMSGNLNPPISQNHLEVNSWHHPSCKGYTPPCIPISCSHKDGEGPALNSQSTDPKYLLFHRCKPIPSICHGIKIPVSQIKTTCHSYMQILKPLVLAEVKIAETCELTASADRLSD